MSEDHLVIVGASLAGLRAVEAVRGQGFGGRVTLVGAEDHLPYDRPPLSKDLLDDGTPAQPRLLRTEGQLAELDVELMLGTSATGLDPLHRRVRTTQGDIGYSALLIATGVRPLTLPGTRGLSGVHTLRTIEDSRAVRAALDSGARVVVAGAGFIGSEVASAARKRGLDVTIVDALDAPLARALGPTVGSILARLHADHGTTLRLGTTITGLRGSVRVEAVELSDGSVLPADLVVVGIGARPATEWLAGSGVHLHPKDNGVVCDANLLTNVPGVAAAGDVAHWVNPVFGESMRVEHWTSAAEQGARAALNVLDPASAQPCAIVPVFWSTWYGARIQFAGRAADEYELVSGTLSASDGGVLLFRRAGKVVGVLTVNKPAMMVKLRRLVEIGADWAEAVELATTPPAPRPAPALTAP